MRRELPVLNIPRDLNPDDFSVKTIDFIRISDTLADPPNFKIVDPTHESGSGTFLRRMQFDKVVKLINLGPYINYFPTNDADLVSANLFIGYTNGFRPFYLAGTIKN